MTNDQFSTLVVLLSIIIGLLTTLVTHTIITDWYRAGRDK